MGAPLHEDWICVSCLCEFADAGSKRLPEYFSSLVIGLVGLLLLVGGVLGLYRGILLFPSDELAVGSLLAMMAGVGAVLSAAAHKRGLKAICPKCGKAQGIRHDANAELILRHRRTNR
jgi:uncharacterized protein (DUF983 family)